MCLVEHCGMSEWLMSQTILRFRKDTLRVAVIVAALCLAQSAQLQAKGAPKSISPVAPLLGDSMGFKDKVVYVDFWASWCVPCRKSLPWLEQVAAKYAGQGLAVIAVNVDKERAAADEFLGRSYAPLRVVFDPSGSIAKRFDLDVMPTSFIYGADGTLREVHRGFTPEDVPHLDSLVASLLKVSGPK